MRKAKVATMLVGAFVALTSILTAPAKAGSLALGVSGEVLRLNAYGGQESLKGASAAGNASRSAYAGSASGFIQYTFQDDGFVIGIERIPYEQSLGSVSTDRIDQIAAEAVNPVTNSVEAALKNHTSIYIETPGIGWGGSGGLYLTGGWTSADLLTKEVLGTGSSYPDADLDGKTVGIGIKSGTDSGILGKIVAEYTDYDDIKLTSTGSDTASVIDAKLDTMSLKVSIGYSF